MKFIGNIRLTEKSAQKLKVDIDEKYLINIVSKVNVGVTEGVRAFVSIPKLEIKGEIEIKEINFLDDEIQIEGWLATDSDNYLCQVKFSVLQTIPQIIDNKEYDI